MREANREQLEAKAPGTFESFLHRKTFLSSGGDGTFKSLSVVIVCIHEN
jgi:hypothetical protein